MPRARNLTALAFVAMAFAIVGLVGVYASFAAPLPLQRALLREAVLDAALAATQAPNPEAALQAILPRLGDSAPALRTADRTSLPARIQAERIAMRARFESAAADLAFRLRLLIGLITLSAVAFTVVIIGMRPAE